MTCNTGQHFAGNSEQPRSQGPVSTSRKYPGCGWSRVYVYKSKPHRGWIIDLVLSTLSMEVEVVLLFYRSWKLKASYVLEILPGRCFSPFYLYYYEYDMLIEREVCLFSPLFTITVNSLLWISVISFSQHKNLCYRQFCDGMYASNSTENWTYC